MKKKLALILSIVLVLAAVVCLFAFPASAADEYVNANTTAKALWNAVKAENKATAFSLTTAAKAEITSASGNLADIDADWSGTYTFADGILTLKGNGNTISEPSITANGAIWIVLDNININGVINTTSLITKGDSYAGTEQAPDVDMPLIISSPIDAELNLVENGVGGMIVYDSANTIRHNCSMVVMGDVGFEIGKNFTGERFIDGFFAARANPNYRKTVVIANGRESVIGPANNTGACLGLQYGGTLIFDNTAKLTVNGSFYNNYAATDTTEFHNNANVVIAAGASSSHRNFLVEDNATVTFNSLSGKANPLTVGSNNANQGVFTVDDNAVVNVNIPNAVTNWDTGISIKGSAKVLGGTVNIDMTCSGAVEAGTGFSVEFGSAEFTGGTMNISINAPTCDRVHGIFLKNMVKGEDVITFGGTNINFDLVSQQNNTTAGAVTTQIVTSPINMTDGIITFDGATIRGGLFCLRGENAHELNILGGTILGNSETLFYLNDVAHKATVGPNAVIDFDTSVQSYRLSGTAESAGAKMTDTGVTYFNGASLSALGKSVVTANAVAAKAALVTITDNAGKVYNLNLSQNVYPAGSSTDAAQAYLSEAGKLVINNLVASKIEATGALTVEVKGADNKLGTSNAADNDNGIRVDGPLTVTGATGTKLAILTYTKALYNTSGDMVINGDVTLDVDASNEAIYTETTAGAMILEGNAKIDVLTTWRGAFKVRGANAAGEGILIRGNVDIDVNNSGNYAIWMAGAGDLKMTSGTFDANGYEMISAKPGDDQCGSNKVDMSFLGGTVNLQNAGTKVNSQWTGVGNNTGGKVVFENVTVTIGKTVDTALNAAINVADGSTVEFRSGAKITAYAYRSTILTQRGGGIYFYDGCDVKAYGRQQTLYIQGGDSEVIAYGGKVLIESTALPSYGYGAIHDSGTKGVQFLGGEITVNSDKTAFYKQDMTDKDTPSIVIGSKDRTAKFTANAGQLIRLRGYQPNIQIIGKNTTVDYNARSGSDAILFEANYDLDSSVTTNVQYSTFNIDGATLIIDENQYNGSVYSANAAIRMSHGGSADAKTNFVPYHNLTVNDAKLTLYGRGQVLITDHYNVTSAGAAKSTIQITGASDVDIYNISTYHGIEMRSGVVGEFLVSGTSTVDVTTGMRADGLRHAVEMNANLTVCDDAALTVNANLTKNGDNAQHALYVKGTLTVEDTASVKATQTNTAGGRAVHAEKGLLVDISSNDGSEVNFLASTVSSVSGHTFGLASNGDVTFKGAAKAQISSKNGIGVSLAGNFLVEGDVNLEVDSNGTAINAGVAGKTIKFLGGYSKIDNNHTGTAYSNTIRTNDGDIIFDAKVDINTELNTATKSKWVISCGLSGDIVFEDDADVQVYGLNSTIFKGNHNGVTGNMYFEEGCEVDVYSVSSQGIRFQGAVGNLYVNGGVINVNSHADAIVMDKAGVGDVIISGGEVNLTSRNGRAMGLTAGSSLLMQGGVLNIDAINGDAIEAVDGGSVTLIDAEVNIESNKWGMDIVGGDLYIVNSDVTVDYSLSGISVTGDMAVEDGSELSICVDLDAASTWAYGIDTNNFYMDGENTVVNIELIGSSKSPTVGFCADDQVAYFNDGTMNIFIDNDNSASSNRNHAVYLKTKEAMELAGTDFNVIMDLEIADTYLAGMLITQDVTTPLNITGGNLDFRGDEYVNSFIKLRGNAQPVNITGGTITGSAKYFYNAQSGVDSMKAKTSFYDQVVTIGPDAKIDFFSYSGDTHYLGQFNADNQTYYNNYVDKGVEYLYGCEFASNDYFLTTANMTVEGATSQVALTTNSGATETLYINPAANNNRIFYGEDGEPAVILNAGGNVSVIDSVDVAWLNANGNTVIDVQGDNVFNNKTGNNAISAEGTLTLKGDGSLDLSGKQYVLYSNIGITIEDDVKVNLVSTNGCGIHVGRYDPTSYLHITDNAEVTASSSGSAGRAIYVAGYNTVVTIDGNAVVDLAGQVAGIYALNDTPDGASGSATVNIGGDAVVTADANYGIFTKGGNSTINVYENAKVDIPTPGQALRAEGANSTVNLSGNSEVLIDTPTGDGIHIVSNVLGAKGIDQVAELNVSDNANLTLIDAASCGARILVNTELVDEDGNRVAGDVGFSATGNANVNMSSGGQTIYLLSTAEGSSANFTMSDAANVTLTNNHPTGQYGSALTVYSTDNNVDITSTGTLNVTGKAAGWAGAFYVRPATSASTSDVLIKDTTVNVKNISSCKITDEEVKGFASDVSNAVNVAGNGVFEITGKAVVNAYAEKNGTEFKNRAHGLFLGNGDNMTLKVSGRAKATFTGAGNSDASTGAGIHSKGADIIVTDRATLKAYGKGTAVAGITFEGESSLTANGYGWADIKVAADGGSGIRSYNNSTKAKVTVEEGGLITITGDPAYKKSGTRITISATGSLAGEDKASAVETDPKKLTGKEGYIRLNGVNPNTSDFTVTFVAIAAVVLAVVAAGVVIVVRRRKAQED